MINLVERCTGYMGCHENYEQAPLVLLGVPMDFTVSFRPGTRQGPQQIRKVSYGLEEYSFYLKRDLRDYSFCDLGDIVLPFGNIIECLRRIDEVAQTLFKDNKFPLVLGGEHLISLPFIERAAQIYPNLAVLQFDAHADLREEYMGERYSHATVMRRVFEVVGGKNLYQFGIRSGDGPEFEFARENTKIFAEEVIGPLKKVLDELGEQPLYVTLDIDVVDPSYAPGTGTPEPGGISSREALEIIYLLSKKQVVGFDLVEVCPPFDYSENTSILAAKIVREAILSFCKK